MATHMRLNTGRKPLVIDPSITGGPSTPHCVNHTANHSTHTPACSSDELLCCHHLNTNVLLVLLILKVRLCGLASQDVAKQWTQAGPGGPTERRSPDVVGGGLSLRSEP